MPHAGHLKSKEPKKKGLIALWIIREGAEDPRGGPPSRGFAS